MKPWFKFGLLAASLLAASVCTQAHAVEAPTFSSQTFISASGQISSLSYQLIDLTPDDGIAPSIAFVAGPLGYDKHEIFLNGQVVQSATVATDRLLLADQVTAVSASGIAQGAMGPSTIRAEVQLSEQDYANHAISTQEGDLYFVPGRSFVLSEQALSHTAGSDIAAGLNRVVVDTSESGPVYRLEGEPEPVSYFTLSPNTEMVISGVAQVQVAVDTSALTHFNANEMQINVGASNGLTAHFLNPVDGATSWTSAEAFDSSILLSRSLSGEAYLSELCPNQNCLPSVSKQEAFSFRLTNVSANDMQGRLTAFTNASVFLRAAAPVPEPSTYVLMGLGLAALACAKSRKQFN